MPGSGDTLLFEGFRLDCGGLFRVDHDGNPIPVPLGSRGLDLLGLLAGRQGELISKDEIMAAVWPRTVVEDGSDRCSAPHPRRRARTGQLYPERTRTRLSLCRAGDARCPGGSGIGSATGQGPRRERGATGSRRGG